MMKGKGLFQKHRNPADEASFETFLRQSLRTPGHQTQSREQLEQRALLAKDAARETLLNQAAVAAASAPSTRSFSGRFSFRPRRLAAVVSAAVVLLAAGIGMPASGEYRINLQMEQNPDGNDYICPEGSDNLDPNTANQIFEEIAKELNCPQVFLQPYATSIFCKQKFIQPDVKYALIALSVNSATFYCSFEYVGSNYSQTTSSSLSLVEIVPINKDYSFSIYYNSDLNSGQPYIGYLIYDTYVVSISSSTDYNSFLQFIQNLTINFD